MSSVAMPMSGIGMPGVISGCSPRGACIMPSITKLMPKPGMPAGGPRWSGIGPWTPTHAPVPACSWHAASMSGMALGMMANETITDAISAPAAKMAVATARGRVKRAAWAAPRGELRG